VALFSFQNRCWRGQITRVDERAPRPSDRHWQGGSIFGGKPRLVFPPSRNIALSRSCAPALFGCQKRRAVLTLPCAQASCIRSIGHSYPLPRSAVATAAPCPAPYSLSAPLGAVLRLGRSVRNAVASPSPALVSPEASTRPWPAFARVHRHNLLAGEAGNRRPHGLPGSTFLIPCEL